MYIEKGYNKFNFIELLLALANIKISVSDVNIMQEKYSLCEDWRKKIEGKKIVCFWLSQSVIVGDMNADIYRAMGVLDYIRKICKQNKEFIIWWIDDGAMGEFIEQGDNNVLQKKYDYQLFLNSIKDDSQVIYDNSGKFKRVLSVADIFFGDEGYLSNAFRRVRKPVFIQDAKRQNFSSSRYVTLDDWLKNITDKYRKSTWKEPNGWQKACHGRKIVLYYQDVEALIGRSEAVIDRLERMSRLAQKRKKICFYWCGSQNNEKVVSILPEKLKKRYRECQQIFHKEENCIVDTINTIIDSLPIVDAYYGDDGIWIDEFLEFGKNVIHQSYDLRANEELIMPTLLESSFLLNYIDGVWVGDAYYFTSWYGGNGLFYVIKGTRSARFVSHIPISNNTERNNLFCAIEHYEGKLFLIPTKARELMIYDLCSGEWNRIGISRKYMWDSFSLFSRAIRQENIIWLMPLSYYAIGRLDLKSKKLKLIGGWGGDVQPYIYNPDSQHFVGAVKSREHICFGAYQSNHIIVLSIRNQDVRVERLEIIGCGLTGICTDGEDFWLVARDGDGSIYQWSPQNGIKGKISGILPDSFDGQLLYQGGNLWLFSACDDSYIKYNIKSRRISKREHYLPIHLQGKLNLRKAYVDDKYLYFLPNMSEEFLRINVKTEEVEIMTIKLDENDLRSFMKEQFNGNEFKDNDFYSDNEMASYLEECNLQLERLNLAGKKIYENFTN